MPDRAPDAEPPFKVDPEWSRAVYARRTGELAAFFSSHLRPDMRLLDCGCGPGTITASLAQVVAPGDVVGIDIREEAVAESRQLARERGISNLAFEIANVYRLPFPDGSFDAAFASAVIQHLGSPIVALREMRRVLKPGGVIGIIDGSSPITFRFPTNPELDAWDALRVRERDARTGNRWDPHALRASLREAGFTRAQASGMLSSESAPPAGTPAETRRVADTHLIQLRGMRGKFALEQGWVTQPELDRMADAIRAWGDSPDAFYARPVVTALAWV